MLASNSFLKVNPPEEASGLKDMNCFMAFTIRYELFSQEVKLYLQTCMSFCVGPCPLPENLTQGRRGAEFRYPTVFPVWWGDWELLQKGLRCPDLLEQPPPAVPCPHRPDHSPLTLEEGFPPKPAGSVCSILVASILSDEKESDSKFSMCVRWTGGDVLRVRHGRGLMAVHHTLVPKEDVLLDEVELSEASAVCL